MAIKRKLTAEELKHLANQGVDISQLSNVEVDVLDPEETSVLEAQSSVAGEVAEGGKTGAVTQTLKKRGPSMVVGGVAANVAPRVATSALARYAPKLVAAAPGWTKLPAALVAGGVAAMGATAGAQGLQDEVVEPALLTDEERIKFNAKQAEVERQFPKTVTTTDLVGGAVLSGGRPSIRNPINAAKAIPRLLESAGQNAEQVAYRRAFHDVVTANAVNAGITAGQQLYQTGEIDPTQLALSVGAGTAFSKQNPLFARAMGQQVDKTKAVKDYSREILREEISPTAENIAARDATEVAYKKAIKPLIGEIDNEVATIQAQEAEQAAAMEKQANEAAQAEALRTKYLSNSWLTADQKDVKAEYIRRNSVDLRKPMQPFEKAAAKKANAKLGNTPITNMREQLHLQDLATFAPQEYAQYKTQKQAQIESMQKMIEYQGQIEAKRQEEAARQKKAEDYAKIQQEAAKEQKRIIAEQEAAMRAQRAEEKRLADKGVLGENQARIINTPAIAEGAMTPKGPADELPMRTTTQIPRGMKGTVKGEPTMAEELDAEMDKRLSGAKFQEAVPQRPATKEERAKSDIEAARHGVISGRVTRQPIMTPKGTRAQGVSFDERQVGRRIIGEDTSVSNPDNPYHELAHTTLRDLRRSSEPRDRMLARDIVNELGGGDEEVAVLRLGEKYYQRNQNRAEGPGFVDRMGKNVKYRMGNKSAENVEQTALTRMMNRGGSQDELLSRVKQRESVVRPIAPVDTARFGRYQDTPQDPFDEMSAREESNRQYAEDGSEITPTTKEEQDQAARDLGMDRSAPPLRVNNYSRQEYAPDDLARYNELVTKVKARTTPIKEKFAMQGELETLRNKYGGMGPSNNEGSGAKFQDVTPNRAKGWDEQGGETDQVFNWRAPKHPASALTTYLVRGGQAKVSDVLMSISIDTDHARQPYAKLAKDLLEIADKDSLNVPVKFGEGLKKGRDRSYYSPSGDYIMMSDSIHKDYPNESAQTLVHEMIHAMTSKKLPFELSNAGRHGNVYGKEYLNNAIKYTLTGENHAIKTLVNLYMQAAVRLNYYDTLFNGKTIKNPAIIEPQQDGQYAIYATTETDIGSVTKFLKSKGISYNSEWSWAPRIDEASYQKLVADGDVNPTTGNRYDEWLEIPFKQKATAGNADLSVKRGVPYGMGNLDEFLAEAFSNPEFQKKLASLPSDNNTSKTIFQKIVSTVRELLGLAPDTESLLADVIRNGAKLISQARPTEDIRSKSVRKRMLEGGKTPDPYGGLKEQLDSIKANIQSDKHALEYWTNNEFGKSNPEATRHIAALEKRIAEDTKFLAEQEAKVKDAEERLTDNFGEKYQEATRNPQIDTPEFKEWFGESKVVDKEGMPKKVYHGTKALFNVFDINKAQKTDTGTHGAGFYFSTHKNVAGNYGPNSMEVYLALKNPYIIEKHTSVASIIRDKSHPLRQPLLNKLGIPNGPQSTADFSLYKAAKAFTEVLQENGYDGIENKIPGGSDYIVFKPEQIKSATGNSGAFDKNNPDIRYQDATRPPTSAEEYVANPNRYGADDAEERQIRIPFISAEIDKIRDVSPTIADSATQFYRRYNRLRGEYGNDVVGKLLKHINPLDPRDVLSQNSPDLDTARNYLLDMFYNDGESSIRLTPKQQQIVDIIHENARRTLDLKNSYPNLPHTLAPNENYYPITPSSKVLDILMNRPATDTERTKLIRDFVEYQESLGKTTEDAEEALNEFMGGYNKQHINLAEQFGPIDKSHGVGIPRSWVDNNIIDVMSRFNNRFARRIAYHESFEKSPETIAALKDPVTGMQNNEAVSGVMDDIGGLIEFKEAKRQAIGGLVRAAMLGPLTGAKDFTANLTLGLQHQTTAQALQSPLKAWADMRDNIAESFRSGVNRHSIGSFEAGESAADDMVNLGRRMRDIINVAQGRNWLEQMTRATAYGQGKWLAMDNIYAAKNNRLTAQGRRFLKEFVPDWQQYTESGELPPEVLREAAARYVESVQGTYDYRGLPAVAQRGSLAPVLSLARWNIEKTNNFAKHVLTPAANGDYRPLLMSTIGMIAGGALVGKLVELVTDKKERTPKWSELAAANKLGFTTPTAWKLAGMASLAGYGGMLGDITKSTLDMMHKNKPQVYENPLIIAATTASDNLFDLVEALREGNLDIGAEAISRFLEDNIQAYRLALNNAARAGAAPTRKAKSEKSEKLRDLRVWKQITGQPVSDMGGAQTNPLLRGEEKQFKRTDDINEAAELLPGLVADAIKDSNGDMERLRSSLRRIKAHNYATMPSLDNTPDAFFKYADYLRKSQGEAVMRERVKDYILRNELDRVKSGMVPSL